MSPCISFHNNPVYIYPFLFHSYACLVLVFCFVCIFMSTSAPSVLHRWLCGDSAVPAGCWCLCERLWQWAVDAAACCCHLWTHWTGAAPHSVVSFLISFLIFLWSSPTFMNLLCYRLIHNSKSKSKCRNKKLIYCGVLSQLFKDECCFVPDYYYLDQSILRAWEYLLYINNANTAAAWL